MKSTEFAAHWYRLTGTTSGTNCPRCGAEIAVLASSIQVGQKISCVECHNKAVVTGASLIWNYAHEGREGLGEAVARSEPRTPPKRAARPKFDESELIKTRAWMAEIDRELSKTDVKMVFSADSMKELIAKGHLERSDLHGHMSGALVGATRPKKKPPGAFETEALEPLCFNTADELMGLFRKPR